MHANIIAAAVAFAGLAAGSPAPAPQMLDFAQITAAPAVASGPTGIASAETATVNTVFAVTTAAVPGNNPLNRRTLGYSYDNQNLANLISIINCLLYKKCATTSKAQTTSVTTTIKLSTTTTTTTAVKLTTTSSSTMATTTSIYTTPSTTSSPSSTLMTTSFTTPASTTIPSTTINTGSTTTTSADGACATTPEEGTYCGFINPEDPCAPQPDGYGPKNLTVDQFYSDASIAADSKNAPTSVPSINGTAYTQVFQGLNASTSASSYLGLYTFQSYDVAACAAKCDEASLCTAFNFYVERDPSQNPTRNDSTAPTVWGYYCPNPDAISNYKCTLWGSNIDASTATNMGQWRRDFQVVIAGSNGYDKTDVTTPICTVPVDTTTTTLQASTSTSTSTTTSTTSVSTTTSITTTVQTTTTTMKLTTTTIASTTTSSVPVPKPTWKPGHNCGGKGVNSPTHWLGGKVFPGPYNPQVCADYAWAQNAANKAYAIKSGRNTFQTCKYFNAVYYHKNGKPWGTYCNLYDVKLGIEVESYTGGYSGADRFSARISWTFELDAGADFGKC